MAPSLFQVREILAGGFVAYYNHPEVTFVHISGESLSFQEKHRPEEDAQRFYDWLTKLLDENLQVQFADSFDVFERAVDRVKQRMADCDHKYHSHSFYCVKCGFNMRADDVENVSR